MKLGFTVLPTYLDIQSLYWELNVINIINCFLFGGGNLMDPYQEENGYIRLLPSKTKQLLSYLLFFYLYTI